MKLPHALPRVTWWSAGAHIHTHSHPHTHTHPPTHTHMCTHTLSHSSRIHTHTHKLTYTQTYTHAHSHTHSHSQCTVWPQSFLNTTRVILSKLESDHVTSLLKTT